MNLLETKLHFLLFILLMVMTLPLKANENDTINHYELDSVVVSTSKLPHTTWSLPASSTALSRQTLQQRQLTDMKDFTASVPNFVMIDRDSRRTSSVFVRGVGSLINAPGVAMYVDGIPHFEKSAFDINLDDIEKIEFLRGPQGTLFGRNAMGGVILVNRVSPFRRQGTELQLNFGSYNEAGITVTHRQKATDRLSWSMVGNFQHSDGFITNKYTNKKNDYLNAFSVGNRIEWRPQSNLNFRLTQQIEKTKQGAFSYGPVDESGTDVDSVSLNHPSYYDRFIYDLGLHTAYHTPFLRLGAQTSLQVLNDTYEVDQDGSPRNLFFAVQGEKQRLISQEINIRNATDGWYGWSFGAFAFQHAIDRSTDVFLQMTKPPYQLEKRYDDNNRGFALFHQSEVRLTPHLKLEGGIRYDFERARSIHKEHKISDEGTVTLRNEYDSPLTFSEWTPKVTLQYNFRNSQLYATWAKGYKTGGFNTVFETEEERTFDPEKSWNYEVGSKLNLLNGKLLTELALFYIDISNQQVKQLLDLQGIKIRNASSSVSKGAEFTLKAYPTTSSSLYLAYGYTHATFKNYTYSKEEDYSGNFLPFVPRHTLNIGAEQRIACRSTYCDGVRLQINYRGMGPRYWHEDNQVEQSFFGLLNASSTFEKGASRITLWGKNLLNTKHLGYYYVSRGIGFGKPGRPFTAGITFHHSF